MSQPEWLQTLEESAGTLLGLHLGEALAEGGGVVGGLNSDLEVSIHYFTIHFGSFYESIKKTMKIALSSIIFQKNLTPKGQNGS